MAESDVQMYGAPPVPIRCAACPMMKMIGRARYTSNNDHLSQPRGDCYCRHPEAETAFNLILPRASRASCFIAYTRGGSNEPDIKTAPRWCPRMLACKPREISKEDAAVIIERRHPYGLFYLKDGSVYVGIDNSDGNAWTEEFFHETQVSGMAHGRGTRKLNGRKGAHMENVRSLYTNAQKSGALHRCGGGPDHYG